MIQLGTSTLWLSILVLSGFAPAQVIHPVRYELTVPSASKREHFETWVTALVPPGKGRMARVFRDSFKSELLAYATAQDHVVLQQQVEWLADERSLLAVLETKILSLPEDQMTVLGIDEDHILPDLDAVTSLLRRAHKIEGFKLQSQAPVDIVDTGWIADDIRVMVTPLDESRQTGILLEHSPGNRRLIRLQKGQTALVHLSGDKGRILLLGLELAQKTKVTRVQFDLRDADGRPVDAGVITVVVEKPRGPYPGFVFTLFGDPELLLTEPRNVHVIAPGYRTQRVEDVFSSRTIQMDRAPRVELKLDGLPDRWPPGVGAPLHIRGSSGGPTVRIHRGPRSQALAGEIPLQILSGVGNQDVILRSPGSTTPLMVPDSSEVTLSLVLIGPRDSASLELGPLALRDVKDGQVLEVEVEAGALAAALTKVSK